VQNIKFPYKFLWVVGTHQISKQLSRRNTYRVAKVFSKLFNTWILALKFTTVLAVQKARTPYEEFRAFLIILIYLKQYFISNNLGAFHRFYRRNCVNLPSIPISFPLTTYFSIISAVFPP
jgi:hypothetical protein